MSDTNSSIPIGDGRGSTSANEADRLAGIPRAAAADLVTLPEGAPLPVVLETAISSATSRSGDRIVARLAEDVRVGEKVAVPAGSEVHGLVTAAIPSGRVKGLACLAFDFDAVVLEGKQRAIGTRPVGIAAAEGHKRDAVIISIGVGGGVIVDGRQGAGIGALIGGTGTGVLLTHKGKEVALGTGTRVTLKLIRETRL